MQQPLMIVCPGRSFSSVVCASIGQHPEAFGLPEVNLFTLPTIGDLLDAAVPLFGIPQATDGLRRTLSELMHGEQTDASVAEVDKWLKTKRDWTGAQMFAEFQRLAHPRILVEKSPTNVAPARFQRMFNALPQAHYLHLSRHPRATCRSRHKAHSTWGKSRAAQLVSNNHEENWLDRHAWLLDLGRLLPPAQYMFLHGEWFFEDPPLVLKQICAWAGLSTEDAAIEEMMHPENSPFACRGPASCPGGNNVGFAEKPHLRVGKIPPENLDDPLDWFEHEDVRFSAETRALAPFLGY